MRNLLRFALALALLTGGCAAPAQPSTTTGADAAVTRPAQLDTSTTQMSQAGSYRIRLTPDQEPVTISTLQTWTVHVETADGQAVTGATVSVDGGMPEHNHGLPTKPLVAAGADGDYRVEGIKFQMPGWWTITVTVEEGGRRDSATFNLLLN